MPDPLHSPVFVGRDDELALLGDALRRAVEREPGVVVVGGEAGVGKTRLVEEFGGRATDEGARVLVGGCVELGEEGMPFAPFVAALRALLRELGVDGLDALVPGARAELAHLLPELGGGSPLAGESAGEWGQGRLFEAFVDLLERLGTERPVVLVLEDLHWADRSTRELFGFLSRGLRDSGVLLVATYRSDDLHRGHPLRPFVAELDRLRSVERFELARFGPAEVAEQLAGILGRAPVPRFVDQVYERSEGNAFFVEELVCCEGDAAQASLTLSTSLRDLLLARVDSLSSQAQRVLRIASAGRRRVDYGLLAVVAQLPEDDLLDALREAVSHNVLVADGDGFSFRHSLLREALHEDLLPGEHGRLHVRYAQALEAGPGLVPAERLVSELAHHWYAAGDPGRALPAALAAAQEAADRYAYAEQRAMLERALALWERVPDAEEIAGAEHLRIVERAVVAAIKGGDHDRALALNDLAIRELDPATDPERAALLLDRRGKLLRDLSRDGGLAALREAEQLLPASRPVPARAVVLSSLAAALMLKPAPRESLPVAEEALELARTLGLRPVEISVLSTLGADRILLDDIDGGLATLDEALQLGNEAGAEEGLLRVRANYSDALHGLGRYEEAAVMARSGIDLARELGRARTLGAFLIGNLADPLQALGRWDEADRLVDEALALDPPGVHSIALRVIKASIAVGRGRFEDADEHLAVARGLMSRRYVGAQYHLPVARATAELALWKGDPSRAIEVAMGALAMPFAKHTGRYSWPIVAVAARGAADLARRARDTRDDELLRQARGQARAALATGEGITGDGGPVVDAWRAAAQAEVARAVEDPRALAAWSAAVDAWEAVGEPFALAYAQFRAAEAAAHAGDRALLGGLTAAAAATSQLGAEPLRREIVLLARRARVELPSPDVDAAAAVPAGANPLSALGLTPREREVLQAVAAGASNRQIADELFISAKTASVHVSNILTKLGVSGRGEAAAVAHRLRLFDEATG